MLANVFSALLPPANAEDQCFYEILGVNRNASNEEIRKAYKKKSLQLHPDKVAQRNEANAEQAAADYEKVQEAYSVLVNVEKRQRYRLLKYSPTRYRFVTQGSLQNPGAMYENLTGASFVDKTRLVLLCSLIVMIIMMQPILIATKINHSLEEAGNLKDTKWVLIFLPYWIIGGALIVFWTTIAVVAPDGARMSVLLTVLEQIAWYIGVMMLAQKWDDTANDKSYGQTLIPVYIAMTLRWLQSMFILHRLRHDIQRMVTVEYLETEVLKGKSMDEMPEDELDEIRQAFVVVTVPLDFEPYVEEGQEELDDKAMEEQKVESSPEYETATDLYNTTFGGLVGSLVFGITFLIVLTLKLDSKIDANYWTVFTPIWIYIGSKWIYNCFYCCCGTITGKEIVLHASQQQQEQGEGKDGDDKKETEDGRPGDSNFVDPETSTSNFNKSASMKQAAEQETKTAAEDNKNSTPTNEGGTNEENQPDNKNDIEHQEDNAKPDSPDNSKQEAEAGNEKNDKNGDTKDKEDGDSEPNIHIDEETFHAWQSAYEAAERGAMEEQARSATECCSLSVKIMLLCLVVAKVDKNYDNDDPSDVGFNTFWIIFPFLLFFGCLFCCCSCLIYGAAPGDASDLYGVQPQENDVENPSAAASNEDTNGVIVPEPPSANASVAESNVGISTGGSSSVAAASGVSTGAASGNTGEGQSAQSIAETNSSIEPGDSSIGATVTSGSVFSGLNSVEESTLNETQESSNSKVLDTQADSMEDLD